MRKGNYQDHCSGFVRIYLDELINGIGAASAEESLRKMQEFEKVFPGAGFGRYENRNLRENLHQRMLGFAVLNNIPPEVARKYIDGRLLERDAGIEILHNPEKFGDQEVFNALCTFGGKKISESKLIRQQGAEAIRLFAAVWRLASAQYRKNGKTLFYLCFGDRKELRWYPLEYTLYYNPKKQKETIYELNPSRSYRFTQGEWYISTYQSYYFNKQILADFLHEIDRRLRLYLKTGHPLKERKEAAWVVPYIESVIEEDRQAKIEAARPKITIDFAGLDKIRQDALETQGSLLTEEDAQDAPAKSAESAERYMEAASAVRTQASAKAGMESSAAIPSGSVNSSEESVPLDNAPVLPSMTSVPLDDTQALLLRMLLRGEPVQALIAAQHGLPHVIADSINEALFDYIGDNAVDCDGETFALVEDYRDEIAKIVGEETT
ncbi:tellurite resistance TerB C-terminal domain-containing protein [Treponema vincentii]|nr:tellurite resistance TerB C-terminal domain-containing protein [Treponema vincentii]